MDFEGFIKSALWMEMEGFKSRAYSIIIENSKRKQERNFSLLGFGLGGGVGFGEGDWGFENEERNWIE